MKADRAATEAAGFADARSYVCWDGRQVLFGKDWKARKDELLKRSQGRCERRTILGKPHSGFCDGEGGEPHHIVPRRKRRDDRLENLANLNHFCHLGEDYRQTRFGEGRAKES